jgi:hypothetical protein
MYNTQGNQSRKAGRLRSYDHKVEKRGGTFDEFDKVSLPLAK